MEALALSPKQTFLCEDKTISAKEQVWVLRYIAANLNNNINQTGSDYE